jgi:hypothetical protein
LTYHALISNIILFALLGNIAALAVSTSPVCHDNRSDLDSHVCPNESSFAALPVQL